MSITRRAVAVIVTLASMAAPRCLPAQLVDPPLGVPATAASVALGRLLFFDPRVSTDGTVSCATCHDPRFGWQQNTRLAVGYRGRTGQRRAPTVLNGVFSPLMFWDGREVGFANQSLQPVVNPIEMGNDSVDQVLNRLRQVPGYRRAFAAAYGDANIDRDRFGHALASFQSTLVSTPDAPVDRFLRGDRTALGSGAEMGLSLMQRASCFSCHSGEIYTDLAMHNDGTEYYTRGGLVDQGRLGEFKTPSLREVGRRPFLGHNGQMDLKTMIRMYGRGATRSDMTRDTRADQRVKWQGWTERQEDYVAQFLREGLSSPSYPDVTPPRLP